MPQRIVPHHPFMKCSFSVALIAATFLMITVPVSNGAAETSEHNAEHYLSWPLRFNLRDTNQIVRNQASFTMPIVHVQQADGVIAIEAEASTTIEPAKAEGALFEDRSASGDKALIHVSGLVNRIMIRQPGMYRAWYRGYFPRAGRWMHLERMNDGEAARVWDSLGEVLNEWIWTQGPVYELSEGLNTWEFVAPAAWRGGARLDKIALFPADAEAPSGLGPEMQPYGAEGAARMVSNRFRIDMLEKWKLDANMQTNGGKVIFEYSYDRGQTWHDFEIGQWQPRPDDVMRLLFRVTLEASEDGRPPRVGDMVLVGKPAGDADHAQQIFPRNTLATHALSSRLDLSLMQMAMGAMDESPAADVRYVPLGHTPVSITPQPVGISGKTLYVMHSSLPRIYMGELTPQGVKEWQFESIPEKVYAQYGDLVSLDDHLILVGGRIGRERQPTSPSAVADIGPNDKPGDWKLQGDLERQRMDSAVVTWKNYIYCIGGFYERGVLMAQLQDDGTLTPWTETQHLKSPRLGPAVIVIDNRMYAFGGNAGHKLPTLKTDSYFTEINEEDGTLGSWRRTRPLPVAGHKLTAVYHEGMVYIFGCGEENNRAFRASIDERGHMNEWQELPELPSKPRRWYAFVVDGSIYLLSGILHDRDAPEPKANIFRLEFGDASAE